jgi:hypothetical protein
LLSLQIKRWINYDQTAYIRGAAQSDSTKYWLFASYAILPLLTGFLGIIPMLFYDLSGKKREKMYAELLDRRSNMAKSASDADRETMAVRAPARDLRQERPPCPIKSRPSIRQGP